jgi:hypothetical protein
MALVSWLPTGGCFFVTLIFVFCANITIIQMTGNLVTKTGLPESSFRFPRDLTFSLLRRCYSFHFPESKKPSCLFATSILFWCSGITTGVVMIYTMRF